MQKKRNVIIVGSGTAGRLLKKDIVANHRDVNIIGFVDDKKSKSNDLKTFGQIDDLPNIVKIHSANEIIIAIPSADGKLVRKVILANVANNVPFKIVPRSQQVIHKNMVKYSELMDISIEDLLGIRIVKKNVEELSGYFKNKTILITGGAGSIGSEIVRQLLYLGTKKVIIYDNSEYLVFNLDQHLKERGIDPKRYQFTIGDILNKNKFDKVVKETSPDIIFHAAAYKHVYLMEDNLDEAIRNNVLGSKVVIDSAVKNKVKSLVFISTDKVVNPKGVMGATKKLAEYYVDSCRDSKTKFNVVRFGNVINSNGSVLPLFERQISECGYVTVTHKDIKRYFMSIREAAQLVITSAALGKGEVFVLDMGELVNIYDIALCLIRSKNLIPGKDIQIKFIGLKKGEKLVEELFTKTERANITKTGAENIFRLKKLEKCPNDIRQYVDKLDDLIQSDAEKRMLRKTLEEIFPSLSLN